MKIGIYGGSFNPPHLGHMRAAQAAARQLHLDLLVLVPAGVPPHKQLAQGSPAPEDRLAMTKLALDQLHLDCASKVWDVELRREGKSYTADTIQAAREKWPEDELWLLMGSDMFLTLDTWYHPEQILAGASVCAFSRVSADETEAFARQQQKLEQAFHARIATIAIPDLVEISSSELRTLLPEEEEKALEYLSPAVLGYILRKHLYGTTADLTRLSIEELRWVSFSMIKARRQAHILGCEETAAALARRWGADETLARRAAILHDCTKYWSREEHVDLCRRLGEPLSEMELQEEKLLHAKSGACLAEKVFLLPPEAASAIRYHTTGRADMSLLEKILYIADYMEPNRTFEGVEPLREAAFTDLDMAVAMGASYTIVEMEQRGKRIDPNTLNTFQFYAHHDAYRPTEGAG